MMLSSSLDRLRNKKIPLSRSGCVIAIIGLVCLCIWSFTRISHDSVKNTGGHLLNDHVFPDPLSVDTRSLHVHKHVSEDQKLRNSIASADPKKCANAITSVFKLSSSISEFQLGETIHIKINLHDTYKQQKTKGGDFVRIWMKDDAKAATAAGVVTDHGDGTYTGSLKALWTGSPEIVVAVVGPRETMDIFRRMYMDHYTLRTFSALFESDGFKEETTCSPIPDVPGFRFVCNLTAENYGLPWYCGKPSQRKLLCHDFSGLKCPTDQAFHFTRHEEQFFDRGLLHQNIPGQLQITVKSDTETVPLPTSPCNKSPLRYSWEASTPVGFFYKNHWNSLTCKNTVPEDPEAYLRCLKDRTLWLHGDSTSRQWFVNFNKNLGLSLVTQSWYGDKWHEPSVLRHNLWNATVVFVPHEYPFYHGEEFKKLGLNRATHAYLDELPNNSRDIFLIHLYLHFLPSPPEYFRLHVQRIVKSVKSLLSRAPKVTVAIRSVHAFKAVGAKGFLDDIWMLTFDQVLREEFKGLEDKVLYLNNIDLTISMETDDPHPNDAALNALIHHFMGSICES